MATILGNWGFGVAKTTSTTFENVAIGFTGNPVSPGAGIGATVSRNSQRLRRLSVSLNPSNSQSVSSVFEFFFNKVHRNMIQMPDLEMVTW
tara:strand:- start:132 stop:404 length:273 start_codon:yes stop_codon:yes gene_type:complete